MKKMTLKKLQLHRETFHNLTSDQLTDAAAGAPTFRIGCNTNFTCPSQEPSFCTEPICP